MLRPDDFAGEVGALQVLAGLWGVELRHQDGFDREVVPTPEQLVAVLGALSSEPFPVSAAPERLRSRKDELAARLIEPVCVVWTGSEPRISRGPGLPPGERVELTIHHEHGEVTEGFAEAGPEGIVLPDPPVEGYHTIEILVGKRTASSLLIVAPPTAFGAPRTDPASTGSRSAAGTGSSEREWGVFLPLHALRTEKGRGIGDLTGLGELMEWVGERGGLVTGTLPLMAAFLEEPSDPSPYSPASRLFWNEVYLDATRLPEFERSAEARELVSSERFRKGMLRARGEPEVDFREVARRQRALLQPLADLWHVEGGHRSPAFAAFLEDNPEIRDYAAFRATVEARGETWERWPGEWRTEGIPAGEYEEGPYRRHLYAQFRFAEQLADAVASSGPEAAGLYLDLPLGPHPGGYDPWAHPELFARGAGLGAPPDALQGDGQSWGLPPIRPEAARAEGHAHFRQILGRLLPPSRYLRIDHVMGLHRLYWIPDGMTGREGAYVRYPAEDLYAILCLESHRHRTVIVGEDLGTVPPQVRTDMDRHGLRRMYVVPFEIGDEGPGPVPAGAVASLNTHDTPPFAAVWEHDSRLRRGLRQLAGPVGGTADRPDALRALRDALVWLGRGPAGMVLVNLEDLWLEDRPQNVPGTTESGNWRRKTRLAFKEFTHDPGVLECLDALDEARGTPIEDTADTATGRRVGMAAGKGSELTDDDLYLFNEGSHTRLYRKLGAHVSPTGTRFAVWAPNAEAVSVIGDFNDWDAEQSPMAPRGSSGIWEAFLPGVGKGAVYKYDIRSRHRAYRVKKADPFGFRQENPPATGSVVWDLAYEWQDDTWMKNRAAHNAIDAPISVYEVHLGSWRRDPEDPTRMRGYREIAGDLAAYVKELGFTHVELMPIMEHPFYGSWGYQTTGYFAPTSRHGSPQDFMAFVDELHQAGIGVILDWVPSHFPSDEHGLAYFDGTHLFEHEDPRQGFHPDWDSLIFNYGRDEVRSFLLSSALFWLDHYHVDGLRVDAVASMLYLDYSREGGDWIPNQYGGRENLEAIEFLRRLNVEVYGSYPDVQTYAEESTAWPMVSRPTYLGGLGFGLKWDMGWMHDTLHYLARDPIHRRHHHNEITFRAIYQFNENFILPLSHDEVVHGKGSLLSRMPGDDWQKRANLRLLFANLILQPGKKLLFMGGELGQWAEWHHDGDLEWGLLKDPNHAGIGRLVADLNRMYRDEPALHQGEFKHECFEWIDAHDAGASVLSFLRKPAAGDPGPPLLAVFNLTPVPRENHRIGVPSGGHWSEILNTDAESYGGTGQGNLGGVEAVPIPAHGRYHSLVLSLPPLGVVVFRGEEP